MLERHPLIITHQLNGPNGDNPNWTAGGTVKFKLDDVPLSSLPRTANKMIGLLFTFVGACAKGITTVTINRYCDNLTMALIAALEVRNTMLGTLVAATQVKGYTLPILEYVGCGNRFFGRKRRPFNGGSASSQLFAHDVFVPLTMLGNVNAGQIAPLAAFLKKGQVELSMAAAGLLVDSGANSFNITAGGTTTLKCSAVLMPVDHLSVGPGMEAQEYSENANNTNIISLGDLGNSTGLDGVEPGAAIAALLALTDARNAAVATGGTATDGVAVGSFTADTVTRYSAPFLGQAQTKHLEPFMRWAERETRPHVGICRTADGASSATKTLFEQDYSGMPYTMEGGVAATAGTGVQTLDGEALFFPLIYPQDGFEITKCPVVEGAARYFLDRTVIASRSNRTLALQLKSWTGAKWDEFRDQLIEEKLAKEVLGTNDCGWDYMSDKKNPVPPAKRRFLPQELLPASSLQK
jgi:hypothetical protein